MYLTYKTKYFLKELIFIILIWAFAFAFISLLKFGDLPEENMKSIYFIRKYSRLNILLQGFIYGGVFGLCFGFVQVYTYPYFIKSKVFIIDLIYRTLTFILIFLLAVTFIKLYIGFQTSYFIKINEFRISEWSLGIIFCCCIAIHSLTDFFLIMRRNMGNGFMLNMIRGKYYKPREEYRIFLFIDLTSSTTIAEEIGHSKFSELLQDCFSDLSSLLLDHQANVYQYVGDEAVITWKTSANFNRNLCPALFFNFKNLLATKSKFYRDKYNLFPKFKAALHEGNVTMASLGYIKTEIVYHGDVLNTTSRMLSLCNINMAELITSKEYLKNQKTSKRFQIEKLSNQILLGKNEPIELFKVYCPNPKSYTLN